MQPEAAYIGGGKAEISQMRGNVRRCQRAYFLEYLAAFLDEELVAVVRIAILAMRKETGIAADVVGEAGEQFRAEDFPAVPGT